MKRAYKIRIKKNIRKEYTMDKFIYDRIDSVESKLAVFIDEVEDLSN